MGDFLFGPKAQAAQVDKGATVEQANQAFNNTQQGLAQQQQFIQALQDQNGIQNQSDVYNQLALQAQGQGPNPAQMALNNATGANVANQAALMAGQRGANQNAGLIARQAAMQGADIQQQAAGQGALMQAQQQQNAINSMGSIAGQQVSNLGGATQGYSQAAGNQQNNVLNAIGQQNSANVSAQNAANEANKGRGFGKALGSIGGAITGIGGLFAHGGEVPKPSGSGPRSSLGKALAMQQGGQVPGTAKVKGDSLKNDTVPAMLSPGEVVVPRTVVEKGPEAAAEFVAAVSARSKSKKKK